jgi:hypothetical protein
LLKLICSVFTRYKVGINSVFTRFYEASKYRVNNDYLALTYTAGHKQAISLQIALFQILIVPSTCFIHFAIDQENCRDEYGIEKNFYCKLTYYATQVIDSANGLNISPSK